MRTPLEVGQIRDVANARERRSRRHRYARIVALAIQDGYTQPYGATITALDGSRRREKDPYDLERCPVVDEQGRAVGAGKSMRDAKREALEALRAAVVAELPLGDQRVADVLRLSADAGGYGRIPCSVLLKCLDALEES